MSDFHERLARLADQVRALEGGETIARSLIQLAADVDSHLEAQQHARYERWMDLFQKWNEFMNGSVEDAHRYHAEKLDAERRRLARIVAGDARWQGGYADALALLKGEQP